MKTQSFWKVFLMVVAVLSLAFLTACGSTNPTTNDENEIVPNTGVVDDEEEETVEVDVSKVVDFTGLTINGVDVLLGGVDYEFPLGETITAEVTVRLSEPSDAPWSGYVYLVIVRDGTDIVFEDIVPLDFPASAIYPAYYTQSASYTPTTTGSYSLDAVVFDSSDEWLGTFPMGFTVVEPTSGPGPIDLGSNCADGSFTLAGVPVVLKDIDCDGLLEQYSCNGGPFVNISHGTTVEDCGLRISNGTPGRDNRDFRWTDSSASATPKPTIFAGGPENDYIAGSATDDLLLGASGSDNLDGRQGNDTIACGTDRDHCDGESGNDKVYGGDGNDWIVGKDGNDELHGGPGDDFLNGYGGANIIYAGSGNDYAMGGSGNDIIDCGEGTDVCKGEGGADTINGGEGVDYCSGGSGDDLIDCGPGEDLVSAKQGNDHISSCDGSIDAVNGGGGTNICTIDVGVDIASSCTVFPCL